jgi:hypothetical protein
MKSVDKRFCRVYLCSSIASALVLGVTTSMSCQAQEGVLDPAPVPDAEIIQVDSPAVEQQALDVEIQPSLPDGVALDNDGNAYPIGGPAGLYNAIIDKQQKLGMTGVYDADGNLVSITYEARNHGQQMALSRLRENLERKLDKQGLLDDGTEVVEAKPLPVEAEELAEIAEAPADETEALPVQPQNVALDNDGNPYPEGGPAGLYNAIVDKQQKLGMDAVHDADGKLESVTYESNNSGHQTALARLRENLERKLKKLGLFDDGTEVPDMVDAGNTPAIEELAVSTELGISKQGVKATRAKIDRSKKPEKLVKLDKATRAEKVVRAEKISKPVRLEKISKPIRVERLERPQKPVKVNRVERPQRPQKVTRVEKPQRPEKPQKPVKPERPGRS